MLLVAAQRSNRVEPERRSLIGLLRPQLNRVLSLPGNYGNRVGIRRSWEVLNRYGIRASATLKAKCEITRM
jgi:hypothetical protein